MAFYWDDDKYNNEDEENINILAQQIKTLKNDLEVLIDIYKLQSSTEEISILKSMLIQVSQILSSDALLASENVEAVFYNRGPITRDNIYDMIIKKNEIQKALSTVKEQYDKYPIREEDGVFMMDFNEL